MKVLLKIFFLSLAMFISCNPKNKDRLIIATAANMQFAMDELASSFSQESLIDSELIISSSGKLTAQIIEGAPFDLFISADMKYPEELYQKGLTTDAPKVYAYGKLVLWTTDDKISPSIPVLSTENISRIAMPNPRIAPYGLAAMETLAYYNIYDEVQNKLVYGESVSQTNQFIISGAAEIGFTAKSVVLAKSNFNQGKWIEIDPGIYSPLAQGVVIINRTDKVESSEKFLEFLFSEKGKEILHKFGYSVNGD